MLNNKKLNIILSLIIAAMLWVYVVGEVQPDTTKQLRGVPITMTRTDVLAERGLAISAVSTETMDVEISGSVLALSEIDVSDVTASVDVGTGIKGENEMTVIVRVPSGITVTDKSLSKVNVAIENLTTKTLDVNVVYTGTFANGTEGETVLINRPQVDVSGAESLIALVDSLRGNIDAAKVGEEETEVECELQALNKDGNPIGDISLSQETVSVKTILNKTVTLPLEVEVVDNSGEEYVHDVTLPETVTVKGRADKLKEVETIKAKTLDVSQIKSDETVPIAIQLPDGIELVGEEEEPKATVVVTAFGTKNYIFNSGEISIYGEKANYTYTVVDGQTVTITAKDKLENIGGLQKNGIEVYIDVSELESSEEVQQVTVKADTESKETTLTISPETINVMVGSQPE